MAYAMAYNGLQWPVSSVGSSNLGLRGICRISVGCSISTTLELKVSHNSVGVDDVVRSCSAVRIVIVIVIEPRGAES